MGRLFASVLVPPNAAPFQDSCDLSSWCPLVHQENTMFVAADWRTVQFARRQDVAPHRSLPHRCILLAGGWKGFVVHVPSCTGWMEGTEAAPRKNGAAGGMNSWCSAMLRSRRWLVNSLL